MIDVVVVDFVPVCVKKYRVSYRALNHTMAKNSESINSLWFELKMGGQVEDNPQC